MVSTPYDPPESVAVYIGVRKKLSVRDAIVVKPYSAVCPANFLAVDNDQRNLIEYTRTKTNSALVLQNYDSFLIHPHGFPGR